MSGTINFNIPGPIDVPQETNSGLDLLPTNNTLIVLPLKGKEGPRKPEELPAGHTKSTEDVMEYLQPQLKVKLKTGNAERPEVNETIRFRGGITAFSPESIKRNSPQLRRLEAEFGASKSLIDAIDKNAQFRKAMDDPDARAAAIARLQDIIQQLTESLPEVSED